MSFFTFAEIVDIHRKRGNLKVSIIGGEPTLWKPINKAIMYCKLHKIRTVVYTNGLETLGVLPEQIYFNINHYFEERTKERVERSLRHYYGKRTKVILRYNVLEQDAYEKLDVVMNVAKRFGTDIHLAPVVPFSITRQFGSLIVALAKKVVDAGIICQSVTPMPPCMFVEDELTWMHDHIRYYSACRFDHLPLVNPDGKTVQPCSKLFLSRQVDQNEMKPGSIELLYGKDLDALRNKLPMEKCYQCEFYKHKKCFGGCLAYR
jgi:hypothetical protein